MNAIDRRSRSRKEIVVVKRLQTVRHSKDSLAEVT
jgi:hypothetical protein